jgi:hypothetical protein
LFAAALFTGRRKGELAGLRKRDLVPVLAQEADALVKFL